MGLYLGLRPTKISLTKKNNIIASWFGATWYDLFKAQYLLFGASLLLICSVLWYYQEERYAFLTEWYDPTAALLRRYQLFYYPKDSSVEMVSSYCCSHYSLNLLLHCFSFQASYLLMEGYCNYNVSSFLVSKFEYLRRCLFCLMSIEFWCKNRCFFPVDIWKNCLQHRLYSLWYIFHSNYKSLTSATI